MCTLIAPEAFMNHSIQERYACSAPLRGNDPDCILVPSEARSFLKVWPLPGPGSGLECADKKFKAPVRLHRFSSAARDGRDVLIEVEVGGSATGDKPRSTAKG
jgi:hypothetical protein